MEDRYEIRGKIAQGGLGAVYKAHDTRMSRDVAIKRIATNPGDSGVSDESTRQLIQEASALASLQHPNIVTIYDVGKDDDGPFVVMELLTGQTLEEIISDASFTWEDFRQLALQSLEALIAAQELHIVHRDIKPGNIMLTWLPSGKFQVKVVDFGLAKLSAKPSLQTIDQTDGVFGSIYFMGPEQFERIPIDQRVDLYALGCVFYYALTGTYPFDGETAVEVMASHLQHQVVPIQEVRAGIPLWACNWIMWLINRQPADRPESARDALMIFMQNENAYTSPELSTGAPTPAAAPADTSRRPKLFIPGAALTPEVVQEPKLTQFTKTASISKPLSPPQGSKPSLHITSHVAESAHAPETETEMLTPEPLAPQPPPAPSPPLRVTPPAAPSPPAPLSPPEVKAVTPIQPQAPTLVRTVPTSPTPVLAAPPTLKAATPASTTLAPTTVRNASASPTQSNAPHGLPGTAAASPMQPKKGQSAGLKVALTIGLSIVVIFMVFFLLNKKRENAEIAIFNELILKAAKEGTTELPVNKRQLDILLQNAVSIGEQKDRYVIYMALYLAKATDSTDIDARIAEFATTQSIHPDIRVVLIRDVLGKRRNPSVINTLLKFAKTTNETQVAVAAIEACRFSASDAHFENFLEILKATDKETIRKAAEDNLATIIKKSASTSSFRSPLITTYTNSPSDPVKQSALRLIGRVGGPQALDLIKQNLKSSDNKAKISAIGALGNWVDQEGFKLLIEHISTETDMMHRTLAFDSAIKYATEASGETQEIWTKIAGQAKIQEDQMKLINGLANISPEPWAFAILENIVKNSDSDTAIDRAERAIDHLEKKKKIQSE